jgi:hypothetical protein
LGDDVYDAAVDLALRLGVDVRDPVVDDCWASLCTGG